MWAWTPLPANPPNLPLGVGLDTSPWARPHNLQPGPGPRHPLWSDRHTCKNITFADFAGGKNLPKENGNFLFSKLKCNKEASRLYAELVFYVVPKMLSVLSINLKILFNSHVTSHFKQSECWKSSNMAHITRFQ